MTQSDQNRDATLHEKFATELHQNMWNNITFAEQKAGFIFVASSGLLVFMNQNGATKLCVKVPTSLDALHLFAWLGCSALLIAIGCIVAAVIPRFPSASQSVFYWFDIAAMETHEAYVKRFQGKSDVELEFDLLRHSYQLARVARKKYRFVRHSIVWGCIGAACTFVYTGIKSGT